LIVPQASSNATSGALEGAVVRSGGLSGWAVRKGSPKLAALSRRLLDKGKTR